MQLHAARAAAVHALHTSRAHRSAGAAQVTEFQEEEKGTGAAGGAGGASGAGGAAAAPAKAAAAAPADGAAPAPTPAAPAKPLEAPAAEQYTVPTPPVVDAETKEQWAEGASARAPGRRRADAARVRAVSSVVSRGRQPRLPGRWRVYTAEHTAALAARSSVAAQGRVAALHAFTQARQ